MSVSTIEEYRERRGQRRARINANRQARQQAEGKPRKTCERCGEERIVPDEISAHANGRVCLHCQRKRVQERQREWVRQRRLVDPAFAEKQRQASREYKRRHAEKARETERRRWQKIRKDPKLWAQHLEAQRLRYRMRQEREGHPVPPVSEAAYARRYGLDYGRAATLPVEPLRTLIDVELRAVSQAELEARSGVPARRFYAILTGESKLVSLSVADRLCTALNIPLAMLYPEAE